MWLNCSFDRSGQSMHTTASGLRARGSFTARCVRPQTDSVDSGFVEFNWLFVSLRSVQKAVLIVILLEHLSTHLEAIWLHWACSSIIAKVLYFGLKGQELHLTATKSIHVHE